ncbi:hypothetical protein RND59_00205 [Vibrio ruber]|uniref:Uncharacterized protein n=1 Tax=Vibrio ruber (strain DSM 16370 / JCM 11486 / BCRC 17186 / CECT 7878 / LMG 23124 / VR1) TaxID=1123498 RepID=A0A1R4LRJ6_VIBR1|nr:hypothetical protein [Vibrio ruber]WNJ95580.1 hypothetical protein RND59_00205 [Vibrio ruber]SJN59210.1 hypothetical protein VR7878_03291 [Vibrio ruber DSM 16370]
MTFTNTRVREFTPVKELLVKIAHHRQRCLPLVDAHSHQNIDRSASRFVKIEKVMLNKIANLFFDQNGDDFIAEHTNKTDIATISHYQEMHFMNAQLLRELKQLLRELDDANLAMLLSYWIAALQVENDELEKYLPQGG